MENVKMTVFDPSKAQRSIQHISQRLITPEILFCLKKTVCKPSNYKSACQSVAEICENETSLSAYSCKRSKLAPPERKTTRLGAQQVEDNMPIDYLSIDWRSVLLIIIAVSPNEEVNGSE